MKSILPTVTDLLRQASLRGGAAPARSRQPVAALFIQDNEPRSACPASAESLVACAGLSYACSPGLLTRRTPRLFARPLAIRRRGTTARPIPAASAPLVANPFGTPSAGDTSVVLLLDRGFRLPASVAHERPLDSGSERIEEELRHLVEALVHVLDGPLRARLRRGGYALAFSTRLCYYSPCCPCLLAGYATGYYTRSDGETDSVFASVRIRRFRRGEAGVLRVRNESLQA